LQGRGVSRAIAGKVPQGEYLTMGKTFEGEVFWWSVFWEMSTTAEITRAASQTALGETPLVNGPPKAVGERGWGNGDRHRG